MKREIAIQGVSFILAGCSTTQATSTISKQQPAHVFYALNDHDFLLSGQHYDEAGIAPALMSVSSSDAVRVFVWRYSDSGITLAELKSVMPALSGAKSCLFAQGPNSDVKQLAAGGVTTLGDVVAGSCPSEKDVMSIVGRYEDAAR